MPDKPNEDECVDMGFGDTKTNKKPPRITKEQSLQAARESGFAPQAETNTTPPHRQKRRRQSGRNQNITIRTFSETIDEFYHLADQNDWGLGRTFEHLMEHYKKTKG